MLSRHLNIIFSCLAIFYLAACNDVEQKSVDETAVIQSEANNLQIENVLGYWRPVNADNYAFEFFPSIVKGAISNTLMTGRMYKANQIEGMFLWDINAKGQINLTRVDHNCNARPISLCDAKSSIVIQASGNDMQNLYWEISHDQDNDGDVDVVSGDTYKKKSLDLSLKTQGPLYLIPIDEYFSRSSEDDGTLAGYNSNGNVEFEFLGGTVSSLITNASESDLSFNETTTVTSKMTFDVTNVGYYDFDIETSFKNVVLRPSVNDTFAYSYEVHRKVIVPEGIDENAIIIDDFSTLEKRTRLVRYIDTFIDAPEINVGDNFFSWLRYSFTNNRRNIINDISFTSDISGMLTWKDVADDEALRQMDFSWVRSIDGTILLNTSDGLLVAIKFIREISGGHTVLMIIENTERTEKSYVVHEFVKDSGFKITDDMFPGRYQIESNDGYSKVVISFTADGIVKFQNLPDLGGHWFINEQGSLISFECTNLFGMTINNYNTCLDSFQVIGTPSRFTQFSHIRELKFLHRDGDDFLVKYNASFWGGPFGVVGPDYITLGWTYRMRRIGDVDDGIFN